MRLNIAHNLYAFVVPLKFNSNFWLTNCQKLPKFADKKNQKFQLSFSDSKKALVSSYDLST